MKFLYDAANFRGTATSSVTNGRVDFSAPTEYKDGTRRITGPNLTVEEYAREHEMEAPTVLDADEFMQVLKDYHQRTYLDQPATEITEERYWYALEVLPPMRFRHDRETGIESFCMSEFTTGTITTQYASANGRYICKNVDMTRPETFITPADFESAVPAQD